MSLFALTLPFIGNLQAERDWYLIAITGSVAAVVWTVYHYWPSRKVRIGPPIDLEEFGDERERSYATTGPAGGSDLLPPPFPHEQRRTVRRGGRPVEVILSDARRPGKPRHGWVLDRSTGGLRIATDTDLSVGQVLNVRTVNAPDTIPWTRVEVCNKRKVGRYWEVGCRFMQTPPWNILLLFG